MKKRVLFGLIAGTVLVWTSVLIIFFAHPSEGTFHAEEHGPSLGETVYEKQMNSQKASAFLKQTSSYNEASTILGSVAITKTWEKDIKEDGKLSIDTLLETLELPSEIDNG
jgi:hypothetical protein